MSAPRSKSGFATLGATVLCLVVTIGVSAVVSYAATAKRIARADLERVQAQALLEGGHLIAALGVYENVRTGRLRWTETRAGETYDILAEPESDKLKTPSVDAGRLAVFQQLGARDPSHTARRLEDQLATGALPRFAQADATPLWRDCSSSVLSYYGRATTLAFAPAAAPDRKGQRPRSGEVWRIVVSSKGFVDERLVRITDSAHEPALLIDRQFGRGAMKEEPCASLFTQP